MRANQSWQTTNYFPLIGIAGITLVFLYVMLNISQAVQPGAHQAQLASGTEGLLKQTAIHLSKMRGGASIGGFPGFEPPDDERYKRRVKEYEFKAQDVNDWVKEINNFLRQIANNNPGMTLEKILELQGLSAEQIENFVVALRDIHSVAQGMQTIGVTKATVDTLTELLTLLGVSTW
jgi:hypothetical protein